MAEGEESQGASGGRKPFFEKFKRHKDKVSYPPERELRHDEVVQIDVDLPLESKEKAAKETGIDGKLVARVTAEGKGLEWSMFVIGSQR